MQAVWPDSFVEESNLAQNIFVLRNAQLPRRGAALHCHDSRSWLSLYRKSPSRMCGRSPRSAAAPFPYARSDSMKTFPSQPRLAQPGSGSDACPQKNVSIGLRMLAICALGIRRGNVLLASNNSTAPCQPHPSDHPGARNPGPQHRTAYRWAADLLSAPSGKARNGCSAGSTEGGDVAQVAMPMPLVDLKRLALRLLVSRRRSRGRARL